MAILNSRGGIISPKTNVAPLTAVLDLPFNGANGSTTFTDIATGKTISRFRNTVISTAQSVSGGSSCFFDGISGLFTSDHPDFNFGVDDFAISLDCFLNTNNTNRTLISKSNDGSGERFAIFAGANNRFIFERRNDAGNIISLQSITPTNTNTWHNIKVARVGTSFTLIINNIAEATGTSSASVFGNGSLAIGFVGSFTGRYLNGYIDSLKIEK